MSDYEISQLTTISGPSSGDLMLIVKISDHSTPPAGSGGSDQKITLSALASALASIGGLALLTGAAFSGEVTVTVTGSTVMHLVSSASAAGIDFTGPGNGAYFSGFNLGDGTYPLDQNPGGHYWGIQHDSGHKFLVFNYNGAGVYTSALSISEAGTATLPAGSLDIAAAGQGLKVAEGSNAKQGTATLVAGSKVVSNTAVTANSRIFLTSQADGGTPGWLRVSARTAGTSFTITSSSATDTSTVAYEIFEPG